MDLKELGQLYKDSGIVGAGGAGFPTYAKLSDKADTILLNCAECEPLLRLHRQLLKFHSKEIVSAFDKTREIMGAKKGIVCIKSHYKGAIEGVKSLLGEYPHIDICILPIVYPAGDEVLLIHEATGRKVRPGGLPIESGVAVFNVETMYNAYNALNGLPLTSKLVTVAGEVAESKTMRIPLGAKLKEVVALAGGETVKDYVYWSGGPMMGNIVSEDSSVTKTTNSIFVLPANHYIVNKYKSDPKVEIGRASASCCQCQMCTDLCPRHNLGYPIEPHKIMKATTCNNFKDVEAFKNTFYCSGCGVCEMFACPQGLSPRKLVLQVKNTLRANGFKPSADVKANKTNERKNMRRVPLERLVSRLGVKRYQTDAPLNNELIDGFNEVNELLSEHIGSPSKPIVKMGQKVEKGQVIAVASEGLSVNLHASISGLITSVDKKQITIRRITE